MTKATGSDDSVERRHWRVTFKVEATGRELTDEVAREHAGSYSNTDEVLSREGYWEDVERQRRLLRAMLADPGVIEAWLGHEAYALFEGGDDTRALDESDTPIRGSGLDGDWEILLNVLGRLSDEDRAVLERAKEGELVYENTDLISECFCARIVGVEVEEEDGS